MINLIVWSLCFSPLLFTFLGFIFFSCFISPQSLSHWLLLGRFGFHILRFEGDILSSFIGYLLGLQLGKNRATASQKRIFFISSPVLIAFLQDLLPAAQAWAVYMRSWVVMGTITSWSSFARSIVCSITSIVGVSRPDHDRADHPWSDRFARSWVLLDHALPSSSILEHLGSWLITLQTLVIGWCDELI